MSDEVEPLVTAGSGIDQEITDVCREYGRQLGMTTAGALQILSDDPAKLDVIVGGMGSPQRELFLRVQEELVTRKTPTTAGSDQAGDTVPPDGAGGSAPTDPPADAPKGRRKKASAADSTPPADPPTA